MFPNPNNSQGSSQPYDPYSWSKKLKNVWKGVVDYGNRDMPMGGTPSPGQNSGAFDSLANSLSAYNTEAMNRVPVLGAPSPGQGWTTPTFAQVTEDDKNLDDFATRNNVPLSHVSDLNKTKTLPPKGSYLQLIQQGVPPAVAASIAGGQQIPGQASRNNPGNQGRGGEGVHRLTLQANQIMQQWKTTGQDPVSIPSAVLGFIRNANGEPLTIQTALQMGYVMNENGILVKAGTPGAPGSPTSGNNWETNPALHIVTWNKNAKNQKSSFKTTEKWAANAYRRKMGKGKNQRGDAPAQPAGPTTREGPTSILDIHLGSG